MPCFCYRQRMFCYLWTGKKRLEPYIFIAQGKHPDHPDLERKNRSRMKIFRVDANEDLPLATIVRNLMVFEETDRYRFSGKSGLSNENGNYNGWFVGYLELEAKTYFFATNIEPKGKLDFEAFVQKRKDLTFEALKLLEIIR